MNDQVLSFLVNLPQLEKELVPIEARVLARLHDLHTQIDELVPQIRHRTPRDVLEKWRNMRKVSRHGLRVATRFQGVEEVVEHVPYFRNMLIACDNALKGTS